jgi:hypothetical protein
VRVVLSKRIPVGRERQVSRLTDKLGNNKWPMGHLAREMAGDNDLRIRLGDMAGFDWDLTMVKGLVTG